MRLLAGTSGFSYKEWKGPFYPADLPDRQMLAYYSSRLGTVEINNTFYRMPTTRLLAGWSEQVPPGFFFALKASRRITHLQRLEGSQEALGHLLGAASTLGQALGPILFQLPPFFKKDAARLRAFLELLPQDLRAAFEFRHASWFDDEIFTVLRDRGCALVVADVEDGPDPTIVATGRFGYLRLRRPGYAPEELSRWAARIGEQPWDEAFVYFKHEDDGAGPKLATALSDSWGQVSGSGLSTRS
jgi:uncharacterized protein YecE (DUF72 family)